MDEIIQAFFKEIGLYEGTEHTTEIKDGLLIIKVMIARDWVKLEVPENSTIQELKNSLYKRWITQLKSERYGLENKILVIDKQIKDIEGKIIE